MQQEEVVYVGPFFFPEGGAEATRVTGISLSLWHAGLKVRIGCGGEGAVKKDSSTSHLLGIVNLNERPGKNSPRLFKVWRALTCGGKTADWIKKLNPPPNAVLIYGSRLGYLFRLIPWCRSNHTALIVDVVEWYDPWQITGGALGPFHLSSELAMRYFHVKAKNLIVISRFLERYYQQRGCRTIRIPPTLDVKALLPRIDRRIKDGILIIAYAGVPGKKDLLNNVVEALLLVDPAGLKVCLVVAGPKPQDLLKLPSLRRMRCSVLPGCVKARGQLTHERALDVVREADFTVLLRPLKRYAQAGFPTKVPESLAVGTPVICNLTSDIGEYIVDGREGLICEDHTVESFLGVLKRAMRLTPEQKKAMRLAARKQAEESFDYRNYTEALSAFIQEAIVKCG